MRLAVLSDSRRTVLVTGATGFIGLNLLHALVGDGHDVIGVASGPLPQLAADSLGRTGAVPVVEQIDIRDGVAVHDVVARFRPHVVIHAAAVTAGAERERTDARTIVDVNVSGTQSVLDACSRNDVGRVLHVSSGAVYGAATFGTDTLDETTHAELHHTDIVIGRLSAVFGPWEYPTGVRDFMSPMLQVVRAGRNGETSRYVEDAPRNWVYAPDAARALTGLALGPTHQFDCYNICPEERGALAQHMERLQAFAPAAEFQRVGRPDEATVSYDADPRLERAPVSGTRIRSELGDDLWLSHDDAFDSYLSWVDSNPGWL
jgi:nucleoside-diphosphate-sugar epimerase